MEKSIWSNHTFDYRGGAFDDVACDDGRLDAARGLLIGLAISQVFWVGLAFWLF